MNENGCSTTTDPQSILRLMEDAFKVQCPVEVSQILLQNLSGIANATFHNMQPAALLEKICTDIKLTLTMYEI